MSIDVFYFETTAVSNIELRQPAGRRLYSYTAAIVQTVGFFFLTVIYSILSSKITNVPVDEVCDSSRLQLLVFATITFSGAAAMTQIILLFCRNVCFRRCASILIIIAAVFNCILVNVVLRQSDTICPTVTDDDDYFKEKLIFTFIYDLCVGANYLSSLKY